MNAVKKLEARTEVGINYKEYSTAVGDAWGDVKVFVESPEGKRLPEFSFALMSAMGKYRLALDIWQDKNQDGKVTFTMSADGNYTWSYLNGGKFEMAFNTWRRGMVVDPKNYTIRDSITEGTRQ